MLGFVISYVVAGLLTFSYWSKWSTLKAGYYCMISMLTIGFGDVVPGKQSLTHILSDFAIYFIIIMIRK